MKKVLFVFGTRPEAIKLAPVIKETEKSSLKPLVCVLRQHKKMIDQVLKVFEIKPDFDLKISIGDRDLFSKKLLLKIKNLLGSGIGFLKLFRILKKEKPDLLVVQGDTSTAFLAAFIGYHFKIPIAHVEAGLRTYNKYQPFPEEINRRLIAGLADYHFAPTEQAKINLLRENVAQERIWVTGNTGIDALKWVLGKSEDCSNFFKEKYQIDFNQKIILVTVHRRESFGKGVENIFQALKEIAQRNQDIQIVYPVHTNPNIQKPAQDILANQKNIYLVEPLDYQSLVWLMRKSYLILTDSGGIQEEAPSLGKPLLVLRKKTERPEGVRAGTARLVGTNKEDIIAETEKLLRSPGLYQQMARKNNPYGDGTASRKIINVLENI